MAKELFNNTTNNLAPELIESEPTVTTDKADYAPGETAEITGNGFTPGSEVVVQIVDDPTKPGDDGDIDEYQPITVITDEFGSFNTTWFVPTDDDGTGAGTPDALNATLFLTATGTGADGVFGTDDDQEAETIFTDGRPTSQNTGTYGSRSENQGQDNVTVNFSFFTDVSDTDGSSDRGFFQGAVAFYTKTTFSTFNQTTTTNADLINLDLSVFKVANFPNYVEISYSFRDPSTNTTVGSFKLIFDNFNPDFPNVPNDLPVDLLVNSIEFIAQDLFDSYDYALDSFFGTPSPTDRDFEPLVDALDINIDGETVVPVDPVATDNTATVTEDGTLTASGNLITDDDGAGTDNDDGLSSQPDFVNLSITEIASIIDPNTDVMGTFGTLDWNADGSYTYSLNNDNATVQALDEGETLTDIFTYTLIDDENLSDTAELTITINGVNDNTPPDAVDDNLTTDEGNLLAAIDLLGNDSDPDGDPLMVTQVNGIANVGTEITLTSGALLTLNSNGIFNYEPNGFFSYLAAGETATDTFSYTISDGELTDTADVIVTIEGASDLFNSGTPFRFTQGTNGGNNTFGFNGDGFFISGEGVSGTPKFQDFDDFLVKTAEVFDGVVKRRGTINDQRLPSGDGPNNINVNANDEVIIGGQGIGGSYKIQFGKTTEAETFRDFVVRMFDEIDANDAVANDPTDFRFDALTGAARLFFDDINNEFGFTTDGGETQTRFNNLEEFVEGIAGDIFGGIQLRDGSFNAVRIAGGKTPSKIRVIGGDDVVIGGQSVGGQFRFDFADAAIAGSFRDVASELFSNIDEANAIAFGDL